MPLESAAQQGNIMSERSLRIISIMGLLVAVVLFVLLGFDGRLHWDEPAYLYTGGYLDFSQIVEGEYQPSGIEGFYLSRILHVLLVHVIVLVTGLGIDALVTLMFIYLMLLVGFSFLTLQILRELMPGTPGLGMAVVVTAFTPMYLYFAFKTMPEIPALFLAGVATLGLLRSMKRRAVFWLSASAISLAGMALLKATMGLLYLSCIVALVLCKSKQYPPAKLIPHAIISGVGSLGIFYVAMTAMGIELSSYLEVLFQLVERKEPLISIILHTLLEGGIFFLAFPLAFFSRHRVDAFFFMIWFVAATVPLLLIFSQIEARYLASNLIAITGLLYCAVDVLYPRVHSWWCRNRPLTVICGCLVLTVIVLTNMASLAIMSHEIRMDQFHTVMSRLDRLYGRNNYAILTPYAYTDFHYLRFVYPEREVYNVKAVYPKRILQPDNLRALEDRFYHGRNIRSLQELTALGKNLVYLGFEENFSVANLRKFARAVPAINLEKQFAKMNFLNQISLSWMWKHPQLKFSEKVRHGHYVAYVVTPTI